MISSSQNVPSSQCYSVCLPEIGAQKKYSILKFATSHKVDFTNCVGGAKLERENNLKEFKSAYDIDIMPKFGAGSEYGREAKEEARKKKLGYRIKKYNPQDQPWLLKLGNGKQIRRFKGIRNGGISENASYYIFMPSSENKFIAHPLDDWYDFTPQAKYKALNADEAEDEFSRRDRTLNHFAIMMKKRHGGIENNNDDEDGGSKSKKKNKKTKSLVISEFDEISGEEEDDDNSNDENKDDDENGDKKTKKKNFKKVASKRQAKKQKGTDDEATEESDEMDEGQEVDYMSGSSSDEEGMYDNDAKRGEDSNYKDAGVEEEEGLRKLVDSGAEDSENEENDDDKKDDEIDDLENGGSSRNKDDKNKDSDTSESSGSDIDSDPEKDTNFLLMPSEKKVSSLEKKLNNSILIPNKKSEMDNKADNQTNSQSSDNSVISMRKRKTEQIMSAVAKKAKLEAANQSSVSNTSSNLIKTFQSSSEESMEELIKRYLLRKPTTSKDLLQKMKSKYSNLTNEEITNSLLSILKKLAPENNKVGNKMFFFIRKDNNANSAGFKKT